jgi:hypothetical protein
MMEVQEIINASIVITSLPRDLKLGQNYPTIGNVPNVVRSSVDSRKFPKSGEEKEEMDLPVAVVVATNQRWEQRKRVLLGFKKYKSAMKTQITGH